MKVEQPLCFQFHAAIVKVAIGDLLFHLDDIAGVMHDRAMQLFKKLEEVDPSNGATAGRNLCKVVVKTRKRFQLLEKFVACGASFQMALRLMACTQDEFGMSVYAGCTDIVASTYTSIVCAASLQILSDILSQV